MKISDIRGTVELRNGVLMLYSGLGVFRSQESREVVAFVQYALDAGYRHIDTASLHGNERGVGEAIAALTRYKRLRKGQLPLRYRCSLRNIIFRNS
jgi:diketogulonate reductase-like aldo/keto reductase